jgi:hypothetical protein
LQISKQFEVLESVRKDAETAGSLTAAHDAIMYLSDMCLTSGADALRLNVYQ